MRPTILFIIMAAACLRAGNGAAQTLTWACNGMRPGDCLAKQEIQYVEPGDSGRQALWDFSSVEFPDKKPYHLRYDGVGDSLLFACDRNTLYRYSLQGDSLLCQGFESRSLSMHYRHPELLAVFPFAFGQRQESYFHGNGDYGGLLFLTCFGKSVAEADACGTLVLPGGDTLRHVLRVHHRQLQVEKQYPYPFMEARDTVFSPDSIEHHLAADTFRVQIDTYRWYADGYRYPIIETARRTTLLLGEEYSRMEHAFFYPPEEQRYGLEDDFENRIKREAPKDDAADTGGKKAAGRGNPAGGDGEGAADAAPPIDYSVGRSADGNEIILDYTLAADATVSIMLFDMQSRQLSGSIGVRELAGQYRKSIPLYGLMPGEYTLRIVVNGTAYGEKIIK